MNNDNLDFPTLETFKELEDLFYRAEKSSPLRTFKDSINATFDRLGFSESFVDEKIGLFNRRELTRTQIEQRAYLPSKVIKDIIWGMIDVDEATVAVLDTPIVQRLRHIRQNGFTYLVFPSASHKQAEA